MSRRVGLTVACSALFSAFGFAGCASDPVRTVAPGNSTAKAVEAARNPPPLASFAIASAAPVAPAGPAPDPRFEKAKKLSTDFSTRAERDEAQGIFQALCDENVAEGGARVAHLQRMMLAPEDRGPAFELAERACGADSAFGCTEVAWFQRGDPSGDPPDPDATARSAEQMKMSCDSGDPEGCAGRAQILVSLGMEASKEAPDWAEKGCAGGSADGCWWVGNYASITKDVPKARTYFEKSCRARSTAGCKAWFKMMWPEGRSSLPAKEYEAATKEVCEMGSGFACMALARIYREGPADLRDAKRGVDAEERACQREWPEACNKRKASALPGTKH